MKKLINICLLCTFVFLSCSESKNGGFEGEVYITSYTNVAIGEPVSIKANNHPANFKSLVFNFGDGTESSGNAEVSKTYEKAGTYTVTLNVVTAGGEELSTERVIKVEGIGITRLMKDLAKNEKVLVMAHRGTVLNKLIPENSISALNACVTAGIDVIEIDTHLTKDGVVVICHDETINRTTNGTGKISDMTLAQIKQYRLLNRNGDVSNETMPTLEEFLLAGRGRILFNLDYSPRTASTKEVYDVVSTCNMVDRVFFYTGAKATYMNEVFVLAGSNAHPYAWGSSVSNYEQCLGYDRGFFVQLDYLNVGGAAMSTCLQKGMFVSVNVLSDEFERKFTGGDFTEINSILDAGVRMIQTDIGESLLGYLKIKGKR